MLREVSSRISSLVVSYSHLEACGEALAQAMKRLGLSLRDVAIRVSGGRVVAEVRGQAAMRILERLGFELPREYVGDLEVDPAIYLVPGRGESDVLGALPPAVAPNKMGEPRERLTPMTLGSELVVSVADWVVKPKGDRLGVGMIVVLRVLYSARVGDIVAIVRGAIARALGEE